MGWNPDHSWRIKAVPINICAQVHVVRAAEGANAARVSIVSSRVVDIVVTSHGIVGCADDAPQAVVQILHPGVGDHAAPLVCIVKNLIYPKTDGVCVRLVEMRSHMIHGEERRALLHVTHVIIQELKRSLVLTCRYLIALTAWVCVRKAELLTIVFFTASLYPYSYSLPDEATGTSIKMPKRLGKIKPPIQGSGTQLAKETTTSLFNEIHWNSLFNTGELAGKIY